jgi:hypothetical protein
MSVPKQSAEAKSAQPPESSVSLWVASEATGSSTLGSGIRSRHFTLIAIIGVLVWTLLIPGIAAYYEGVFLTENVVAKLADNPSHTAKWKEFADEREDHERLLNHVEYQLKSTLIAPQHGTASIEELLAAQQFYARAHPKPMTVTGFVESEAAYVWVLTYGCLILLIRRGWRRGQPVQGIPPRGLLLYIAISLDGWLRNFVFHTYDKGRRLYSYLNSDLGPISFALEEMRALGLSFLLIYLWDQRLAHVREEQRRHLNPGDSKGEQMELQTRALHISRLFANWQMDSLLLAGMLLPWTYFYWRQISLNHDARYVLSAVLLYLLWGGTWLLLSMPLLRAQQEWTRFNLVVLTNAMARKDDKMVDHTFRLLKEFHPVGSLNLLGSSIVAAISFALPVLRLFL